MFKHIWSMFVKGESHGRQNNAGCQGLLSDKSRSSGSLFNSHDQKVVYTFHYADSRCHGTLLYLQLPFFAGMGAILLIHAASSAGVRNLDYNIIASYHEVAPAPVWE